MAYFTYCIQAALIVCLFIGAKSEAEKRAYGDEAITKRLLVNLRSELEMLKKKVLDDLNQRTESSREVTRDANKRDFEGIEEFSIKRTPEKLLSEREHHKTRDAGIEKKQRDFEGIEELRQAKDVRDFEEIEERQKHAEGVRDFEGIEERQKHAEGVRDFEGIEEFAKRRNSRDFEGIEERFGGKLKEKREEALQKALRSLENGPSFEEYLSKRAPALNRRIPSTRNVERSPDVFWDSSVLQKRERFLGRRDAYDERETAL